LDGSESFDPDGDPITYSWQQVSGPAVELDDHTSATPSFTMPANGDENVFYEEAPQKGQETEDGEDSHFKCKGGKAISYLKAPRVSKGMRNNKGGISVLTFELVVDDGELSSKAAKVKVFSAPFKSGCADGFHPKRSQP
jgi:hypothetical protein